MIKSILFTVSISTAALDLASCKQPNQVEIAKREVAGAEERKVDPRPTDPTEELDRKKVNEQEIPESSKRQSLGSGGKTATIVNGLTFELGNLRSQYRLWAPASNSKNLAHRLVVFLHGDTGSNFGPANLSRSIDPGYAAFGQPRPTLDQARAEAEDDESSLWNETIFVSILSPSSNGQFITWNTNLSNQLRSTNANFVHELVQEKILKQFNVNLDQIFFVGQSGGGLFLSGTFIPTHGLNYSGGAIMLCGAMPPRTGLDFNPQNTFKEKFKLHFQTTFNEYPNLTADIDSSLKNYRSIYNDDSLISFERKGNGGHCEFDTNSQPTLLIPIIQAMEKTKT